ncbi:MAG: ABC transporter ATP-binding protein [Anaerolineae bacterium]|nr:ABC transporter ATP-binding protein [Anaerolineae bacterium]
MSGIQLDRLSKHFGSVAAVDEVTLQIQDGEFFALLGPSGCGKTTTLRMIAGLEKATAGTIKIGDRDVTTLAPRERDIAMVFQDYALYPHMNLLDNIGYPLKVRGIPRAELQQRVTEAAQSLGIDHLLNRRPAQLSGGQQQRAAVARAIVHHAQVFLFDEPLSNLDAKLRVEARGFLKHLQRQVGVTTVYVTHDQAEAMALADHIAIMEQGKVVQMGPPLEVYHRPRTTFVASFLGSPPMNLLRGQLDLAARQVRVNNAAISLEQFRGWDRLVEHAQQNVNVVMGIRPEHLTIAQHEIPQSLTGEVYAIQPLGAESLVIVQIKGEPVSVRLFTDDTPQFSGRVWLAPDLQRVFFYHPDGELIA